MTTVVWKVHGWVELMVEMLAAEKGKLKADMRVG